MIQPVWCRWSFAALVALQVIWFGWLYPPTFWPQWMVLTIMVLPLALTSVGVWQQRPRALVICGFILLFYFCYAISEAYATPTVRGIALIQIGLISVYFMALLGIRRQTVQNGSR